MSNFISHSRFVLHKTVTRICSYVGPVLFTLLKIFYFFVKMLLHNPSYLKKFQKSSCASEVEGWDSREMILQIDEYNCIVAHGSFS